MDFDDTAEEASFCTEARAWLHAHAPAKGGPDDFSKPRTDRDVAFRDLGRTGS